MRFANTLLEGRLIRRYKRFFSEIELRNGHTVLAHCPNPGSMKTCLNEGGRVWISRSDNPKRKLKYTWELADCDGEMVYVNPTGANDVVAEALRQDVIAELSGFDRVRREVAYGERSRVDFVLDFVRDTGRTECTYLEVKNVTLRDSQTMSAFPDSVTKRGTRHLHELSSMVAGGHRAALLFCGSRSNCRAIRPADEIDPVYGAALRQAARAGVMLLAYRCDVTPKGVWMRERIPVDLDGVGV